MTRGQTAFTWFVIGAAVATIGWWWAFGTFDWSAWPTTDPRRPRTDSSTELAAIRDRFDQIALKLAERPEPARAFESATPAEAKSGADVVTRLAAIEASLARLLDRREAGPAAGRPEGPSARAKDLDLVLRTAARGHQEGNANTRDYFGWSYREVYDKFGKPDGTRWSGEHGDLFWYYFGTEEKSVMHFVFTGGIVTSVWP
jgi:hypothetical protein